MSRDGLSNNTLNFSYFWFFRFVGYYHCYLYRYSDDCSEIHSGARGNEHRNWYRMLHLVQQIIVVASLGKSFGQILGIWLQHKQTLPPISLIVLCLMNLQSNWTYKNEFFHKMIKVLRVSCIQGMHSTLCHITSQSMFH